MFRLPRAAGGGGGCVNKRRPRTIRRRRENVYLGPEPGNLLLVILLQEACGWRKLFRQRQNRARGLGSCRAPSGDADHGHYK